MHTVGPLSEDQLAIQDPRYWRQQRLRQLRDAVPLVNGRIVAENGRAHGRATDHVDGPFVYKRRRLRMGLYGREACDLIPRVGIRIKHV